MKCWNISAKFVLISSIKDPASINTKESIINEYGYSELIPFNENEKIYKIKNEIIIFETDRELIFYDKLDEKLNGEYFIFLSKHKSESKIPGFYIHAIGNFSNETLFGGKEKELCYTSAILMKNIFLKINENFDERLNKWRIGLEVTHHGPYIEKIPCIFVEIGSSEENWKNKLAGKTLAKSIFDAISNMNLSYIPTVGYGGPHYAPAFVSLQKESEYAIGHIMPSYAIENQKIDEEIILKPIQKTKEKVTKVLIDWKGIRSEEKQFIIRILKEKGLETIKI
jgi:D-aminoacyl-tRNA deacylase